MSALEKPLRLFVAAVAMLVLGAGTVAGCGDDESEGPEAGGGGQPTEIEEEQEGEVAGEATLSEVLDNPFEFYGDTVTVSGEVSQVFVSPGVFTLGGDGQALPVLGVQDAQVPQDQIEEGSTIQAQGTVCQVVANLAELEDENFLFEEEEEGFDEGFFTDFDQQPALFAQSIDASVPEENQDDGEQQQDGGQAQQDGQAQVTVTVQQQGEPSNCPGVTGGATTDGGAGQDGGETDGGATE